MDAEAHAGSPDGGIGGGDEREGAVVEVQERSLGALHDHVLPRLQRLVDYPLGGADHRSEALGPLSALGEDVLQGDGLSAVHLGYDGVGVLQGSVQPDQQRLQVQQIGGPEPGPGRLVAVGRADSFARCAERLAAPGGLGQPVEHDVVGHDEVRPLAEDQTRGDVYPAFPQPVDLVKENVGVHDHAVSDDVNRLGPEHAAGDQVEGELPLLVEHGVPGVVSPGEAGDHIGVP